MNKRNKAECAAERLKEIYPLVEAEGIKLRIPMPGHALMSEEAKSEAHRDFLKLKELISTHDVIFLITDSRESRWLPSILATVHKKICFTVALGFETFLVLRQGVSKEEFTPEIHGENRPGCYFCNDTIAPKNSMVD